MTSRTRIESPIIEVLLGALLAGAILAVLWMVGHRTAMAYVPLYLAALLPGVPLAASVFGRRHPIAWLTGAVLGYALSAAVLWLDLVVGWTSPGAMVRSWIALCAVTAPGWLVRTPLVALPPWRRGDTRALLLVLLLVPALVGVPFGRIGATDAEHNRLYRSYFTADFIWHLALTSELSRLHLSPRDPYAAAEPLHYYWTYFLPPAAAVAHQPRSDDGTATVLLVNATGAGLLFIGAIFALAWVASASATGVLVGVSLAVLAASFEGLYAILALVARGQPLSSLRGLNVDAVSRWFLNGLTIDGLPRALWYTPQHAGACALGLVALAIAAAAGSAAPLGATLLAGLALGAAVLFSPLLGGVFALVFGLAMTVDTLRRRPVAWLAVPRQALAAIPVCLALFTCARAGVFEGAGGALRLGPTDSLGGALTTLALSLGPLLLLALPGLRAIRSRGPALIPALTGTVVGLFLFNFVTLGGTDQVWIGWRAGNLMLVSLPALAAAGWTVVRGWSSRPRAWASAAVLVVAIAGLPTVLIDAYNAADIDNRDPGPGFRWTLVVTPDQQAAYAWIRRWTARDAIVQMEPTVRGREGWSLIPSFANRAMAGGRPISLVMQPYHEYRSRVVRRIYETRDAEEAWRLARQLRIDYIYIDGYDRAGPARGGLAKFEASGRFRGVFAQGDVAIYAVVS